MIDNGRLITSRSRGKTRIRYPVAEPDSGKSEETTMTALYETIIVLSLFLVRLGIPVAVIMLVNYGLKRLDSHWAAGASAHR